MYRKNYSPFLYGFLLLIGVVGQSCNSKSSDKQAAQKSKSAQEAVTDSAFVETYVRQEADFKQHRDIIKKFDRDRNYRFGWFNNDKLVPQANTFISVVNRAHQEGLDTNDYKIKNFSQMFKSYEDTKKEDSVRYKLKQEIDV